MVTIANRVSQKLGQIRFLHQIKEEKLLYMLSTMVCNSKNFFGAKNAQTEICASRAHPFHHKSDNRMPCISQESNHNLDSMQFLRKYHAQTMQLYPHFMEE